MEPGTIYIGGRKAELRAKVYDKRQEWVDKKETDPGPLIRYELTVTNKAAAISLRDAWDPTSLFWHYVGGRLLERPKVVAEWEAGGVGFDLPRRSFLTPGEKLERFLSDNVTLRRGLVLADACGSHGRAYYWSAEGPRERKRRGAAALLIGDGGEAILIAGEWERGDR